MLKKTETEETIDVFGEILIGGPGPLPPLSYAYAPSEENKKRFLQIFREVSGLFQRNFDCSKNSAVLERRTGQFSRAWGFEANTKDLTFEAKA